jgi:hypothetical protein
VRLLRIPLSLGPFLCAPRCSGKQVRHLKWLFIFFAFVMFCIAAGRSIEMRCATLRGSQRVFLQPLQWLSTPAMPAAASSARSPQLGAPPCAK